MKTDPQNHLKKDRTLAKIISQIELEELEERELFLGIVRSINGQQLSVKAAASIFKKINDFFDHDITPDKILNTRDEELRGCGLSFSKIKYLKDLSAKIVSGELDLVTIIDLPDEEFIQEITKVKGIGRWTAEMLLIFVLKREDVFSVGDLGLRTAVAKLYGVDRADVETIQKIAEGWSPYRSLAARYLWRSLDNSPK